MSNAYYGICYRLRLALRLVGELQNGESISDEEVINTSIHVINKWYTLSNAMKDIEKHVRNLSELMTIAKHYETRSAK